MYAGQGLRIVTGHSDGTDLATALRVRRSQGPLHAAEITEEELPRPGPLDLGARAIDWLLSTSNPKKHLLMMGFVARQVRQIAHISVRAVNVVYVDSGNAEIRAAWLLLAASGVSKRCT
jgi:hypothetical protein